MMDVVVCGLSKFANAYLDDLIVYSDTWEDHLLHLRAVLNKLREVCLTTKPYKYQLAMPECTYLGHIVGGGVVKPVTSKIEAIAHFPRPETKKQVRSFLGLTGYYRCFLPNYASVLTLLPI